MSAKASTPDEGSATDEIDIVQRATPHFAIDHGIHDSISDEQNSNGTNSNIDSENTKLGLEESSQDSTPTSVPPRAEELDRTLRHIGLEQFGKALENAARAVCPNYAGARYCHVHVLLISWERIDPNLPVQEEIRELRAVLDGSYHYDIEEFQIPDADSHGEVSEKINAFVKLNNNSNKDLKIVYYAGHSMLSRTKELLWTTVQESKSAESPIVVWSAIQRSLEMAQSDVLILLDCCWSGVLNGSVGKGVTEIICACPFDRQANGVGRFSFTRALTTELRCLKNKRCFFTSELYNRILTRMQSYIPEEIENERYPPPVHLVLTNNVPFIRGIELAVQDPSVPDSEQNIDDGTDSSDSQCIPNQANNNQRKRRRVKQPPQTPSKRCRLDETPDKPRALFAVRFKEDIRAEHLSMELFQKWLRAIPAPVEEVRVEAGYKCLSTLVFITMPLSMWPYMPQNLAIFPLGNVKSSIILPLELRHTGVACVADPEVFSLSSNTVTEGDADDSPEYRGLPPTSYRLGDDYHGSTEDYYLPFQDGDLPAASRIRSNPQDLLLDYSMQTSESIFKSFCKTKALPERDGRLGNLNESRYNTGDFLTQKIGGDCRPPSKYILGISSTTNNEQHSPCQVEMQAVDTRPEKRLEKPLPLPQDATWTKAKANDYYPENWSKDPKLKAVWDKTMNITNTKVSYQQAYVLLLSWHADVDDLQTESEVNALQDVFSEKFKYQTIRQTLTICPRRSTQAQANRILATFVDDHDAEDTLLIVYYAGHGVPGASHGGLNLIGSRSLPDNSDKNEIVWSSAEHILHHTAGDLLVIFDCCHAGELLNNVRSGPDHRAFEYLAATSAVSTTTPRPGRRSFTSALIWSLTDLIHSQPIFSTQELLCKIKMAPDFPEQQCPTLFERRGTCLRKIVLAALSLAELEYGAKTTATQDEDGFNMATREDLLVRFIYDKHIDEMAIRDLATELGTLIHKGNIDVKAVCYESTASPTSISKKNVVARYCAYRWLAIARSKTKRNTGFEGSPSNGNLVRELSIMTCSTTSDLPSAADSLVTTPSSIFEMDTDEDKAITLTRDK